jgi:membrane protease YdiL (CAAX protease family)
MTVIVWAAWKGFQQGRGEPRPSLLIAAIVVSAIVFGAGHLPVAIALDGGASLPLVAHVIVANSIFGVVGGVPYWKKGLESAVIAHALTHVGFLLSGLM